MITDGTLYPPASIDAAALLDEVHSAITDYVAFAGTAESCAVTLWVAATHAITAVEHATRLVIKSPEKRCGKSRLLEVLAELARKSMVSANISEAAIYRSIGDDPPTLFIDEADTIFGTRIKAEQNEGLRGLLNAGFRRGVPTWRVTGPNHTPTPLNTFAMACLAGIGDLPDTIEDRAVVVRLRRRGPTEQVKPYRLRRDQPRLQQLQTRLAAWTSASLTQLGEAEPDSVLEDRAADTWESLLAIADAAGGAWPARARSAANTLLGQHNALSEGRSRGLQLLTDTAAVLRQPEHLGATFISSAQLTQDLRALPDSTWQEENLTASQLARLLKGYRVQPGHDRSKTQRGYQIEDLNDAITRYSAGPSAPAERHATTPRPEPSARPYPPPTGTVGLDTRAGTDGQNRPTEPPLSEPNPDPIGSSDRGTVADAHPPQHIPKAEAGRGNPSCIVCERPRLYSAASIRSGICAGCQANVCGLPVHDKEQEQAA